MLTRTGGARLWLHLCFVAALAVHAAAARAAGKPAQADIDGWVKQATAAEHGEGVPQDYERAADLYCQAARAGDPRAQFALGWMYANGRGLARDDGAASALFGLAAEQGHPQAGRMLRFVRGAAPALPDCMRPPPTVVADADLLDDPNPSPEKRRIIELVHRLAPAYAVDPRLALAVIAVESNFNAKAVSPRNAGGLMQLIPETAERFNVANVFDPTQNIRGGLAYLRWLLAYYQGRVALAAAAYNAGEGAVDRHRGIPPYPETKTYVARVIRLFRQDEHPYDETLVRPSPVLGNLKE